MIPIVLEELLNPANPFVWVIIIAIIAGAIAVLSRPFATYLKFVYPNAKFEAIGNPFIHEKELDNLSQSNNLEGFTESLNASKDYDITGESIQEIQHALDEHFLRQVTMMQQDSSKKLTAFFTAYLRKYDIHLVRNEIKNTLQGNEPSETAQEKAILNETKKLLGRLQTTDREHLPSVLQQHEFSNQLISLLQQEDINLLAVDVELDKHLIHLLKHARVPYKCEPAKNQFTGMLLDIRNIKNLLRGKHLGYDADTCKKLFVDEGRELARWKFDELAEVDGVAQVISGLEGTRYYEPLKNTIEAYHTHNSVQFLELALDQYSLQVTRELSTNYYVTIGPTLRFLFSKEFEIQNLKIIAKAIGEHIDTERMKRLIVLEAPPA